MMMGKKRGGKRASNGCKWLLQNINAMAEGERRVATSREK